MPWVDRPGGDGPSLRAGGHSLGGVVTEGRPVPSYCGFTAREETGCLSMAVVAAREEW